jgi:sugar phosphate isomerase/epimerase
MDNRIGVVSIMTADAGNLREVTRYGLDACQLVSWTPQLWTDETAAAVRARAAETGILVSAFWAGWSGPREWSFRSGPTTLGIVPEAYRAQRAAELVRAGEFAKLCGLPAVITHLGFIPENATDRQWPGVVAVVRDIARSLERLGVGFWFETGQESPVTMLRLIEQVGTGNLGLNLDPANLILYGKANPLDSLDTFGSWVRNVHVKDGLYPTRPMDLGREVKVGQGKVDFPRLLRRLGELGYRGELIIEREIRGEQQARDIRDTVAYLRAQLEAAG